jgi:hypothetical protein
MGNSLRIINVANTMHSMFEAIGEHQTNLLARIFSFPQPLSPQFYRVLLLSWLQSLISFLSDLVASSGRSPLRDQAKQQREDELEQ